MVNGLQISKHFYADSVAGGNIARIFATMTIIDDHCNRDLWSTVFKSSDSEAGGNIARIFATITIFGNHCNDDDRNLQILNSQETQTRTLKCKSFLR